MRKIEQVYKECFDQRTTRQSKDQNNFIFDESKNISINRGEWILKICPKCEMIVLGQKALKCPDCDTNFQSYRRLTHDIFS